MCDRNAKSEYILIKLSALKVVVKEVLNFMRKYCLTAEYFIFKYR